MDWGWQQSWRRRDVCTLFVDASRWSLLKNSTFWPCVVFIKSVTWSSDPVLVNFWTNFTREHRQTVWEESLLPQVYESLLRTCWNTVLVVRALLWTIWQPNLTLYWQAYAETSRSQWVKDWPGQVVLCTSQIYWTLEVHEAIQAGPNVGFFLHYFI